MAWWQYLVTSIVLLVVGGVFGYLLNRRGMKAERNATEQRQLRIAVKGLLTEMNANLKLIEKGPELALLPPLATDMWNIHKSRIVELPSEMQTCLHEAYAGIAYVNAVPDIRAVAGTRGRGPGAWDTRYKNEAEKARNPMEEARNRLEVWLKAQKPEPCGEAEQTQSNIEEVLKKHARHQTHVTIAVVGCSIILVGVTLQVGLTLLMPDTYSQLPTLGSYIGIVLFLIGLGFAVMLVSLFLALNFSWTRFKSRVRTFFKRSST